MSQKGKLDLRILVEASICAALAMVLSALKVNIGWIDISLGQTIIVLFGLRRGLGPGLLAGLLWGLLHFVTGQIYYLSLSQVIIEYIVAFVFGGTAGIFRSKLKSNTTFWIVVASFFATFARFFWHFVAGVIFWSQYAWKGWGAVSYSLVINGTSALLTALIASIVVSFIVNQFPKILQP
ncbi:energy-coupled thiamine transporter ThiT [Floricoccus penangensis]|uniref:energy-coupled thiamine transporter ThiT n=1 Tax=Floricoccus penangensis TaxID=1859475 RepID=UPI0020409CA8|nr:energy-coupled thiamine transporter ThiT [Floricoccus penangensis]URZ87730.1 energy-coupled thiamine transporter ThiT [Floricoccus penangensis]